MQIATVSWDFKLDYEKRLRHQLRKNSKSVRKMNEEFLESYIQADHDNKLKYAKKKFAAERQKSRKSQRKKNVGLEKFTKENNACSLQGPKNTDGSVEKTSSSSVKIESS